MVASATRQQTQTTWTIDATHSLAEFAVKHMMFSTVKGRFGEFTGTIQLDDQDLSRSSVNVEINAASIDTRDAKRDEHLRSGEFFDVAQFPTITFVSTRVEPGTDGSLRVTGDLTIRDVTREVTMDVVKNGRGANPWGAQVIGYTATTQLDRRDYGLTWNAALEAGGVLVGDTVKIAIEAEANLQA